MHRVRPDLFATAEACPVPPAAEVPQVTNLMEALQQSIAQAKKAAGGAAKPPKLTAPSADPAAAAKQAKKRKTS